MNTCLMCRRWEEDVDLRIVALPYSYVVLNRDQFFPGYVLLFSREHVTELFHLEPEVRHALMDEVALVAQALASVYRPAKMNYELLGNMVPHLHWHLVPRFSDDPLWPRPIWSEPHDERSLSEAEATAAIAKIRHALAAAGLNLDPSI
ncbi:MAG: HIT family protein [Desulfuromonas sp.]|nr:MAG: HIT family protein [Desulfuromonas sp.]